MELIADPASITSVCPVKITFTGRITATGRGVVSFRWVSSDGDTSEVKTVFFSGPDFGTAEVYSDWRMDETTVPSHAGWSAIEIVHPLDASSPVVSPHAAFAFTCDDSGFETIGFGIGGSDADCSLGTTARTFAPTDPIRVVADYSPALQAHTIVKFQLSRDGAAVEGNPSTVTFDESTKCVHGDVSKGILAAGHYRLDIEPDTSRPVGGEFDVK